MMTPEGEAGGRCGDYTSVSISGRPTIENLLTKLMRHLNHVDDERYSMLPRQLTGSLDEIDPSSDVDRKTHWEWPSSTRGKESYSAKRQQTDKFRQIRAMDISTDADLLAFIKATDGHASRTIRAIFYRDPLLESERPNTPRLNPETQDPLPGHLPLEYLYELEAYRNPGLPGPRDSKTGRYEDTEDDSDDS